MLHAFNAAPAANAHSSPEPLSHIAQPSQHNDARQIGSAPLIGSVAGKDESCSSGVFAVGHTLTDDVSEPASSHAVKWHKQQHGVDPHPHPHPKPHHLTPNRITLARISDVAQEQMEHKMRKARQGSIEKHVAQHDMFAGRSEPAHTVHHPDAAPETFQEPTLAAILRESALAEDLARRETEKAARAADDALPLFVTTSSCPESTLRQHSRSFGPLSPTPRQSSRPVSAANTLTRRQVASELSSGLDSLSKSPSLRGRSTTVRDAFSPSSTGRLVSMASCLQRLRGVTTHSVIDLSSVTLPCCDGFHHPEQCCILSLQQLV